MADDPFEVAAELAAELDKERPLLRLLDRYYRGRQPAAYLHPDIAADVAGRIRPLRINWPRKVLDTLLERLKVEGFRLTAEGEPDLDLWSDWQASNMDLGSKIVMRAALKHGRAAMIVWSDKNDPEQPRITVESAKQVKWLRDPQTREVTAAIKTWTVNAEVFCNVYLPDQVLKLQKSSLTMPHGVTSTHGWFTLEELDNPLGVVPVVPVVNRPDLDDDDDPDDIWCRNPGEGESEMADILDPADAVNKLLTDMMVTAEYYAMPRRWATGTEPPVRPPADDAEREKWTSADNPDGLVPVTQWQQIANRVWTLPEEAARVGQFTEAELQNYATAVNLLTGILAALGKLPPHYVGLNTQANPASADAIRSAEASLVSTAYDLHEPFGDSFEEAARLARRIRTGRWDAGMLSLETVWKSPEIRTVAQQADAAVKLKSAGIITTGQAQEDVGYGPVARARMKAEQDQAAESAGLTGLASLLNPGPSPEPEPALTG